MERGYTRTVSKPRIAQNCQGLLKMQAGIFPGVHAVHAVGQFDPPTVNAVGRVGMASVRITDVNRARGRRERGIDRKMFLDGSTRSSS